MRGATNMLSIKAQLLIAVILVCAAGVASAEPAVQTSTPPVAATATEVTAPKAADAVKKPDARKPADQASTPAASVASAETARADAARKADVRKPNVEAADQTVVAEAEVAVPGARADVRKLESKKPSHTASSWRCGWGFLPWFESCSSGRVGLVLGTAY